MTTDLPGSFDEVLERAARKVAAGELVVEYTEDVELHAPIPQQRTEPVELTPDEIAALRRVLGPRTE